LTVVKCKNVDLADLAERAANDAERLLANAKRAVRKAKADAARRKTEGRSDAAAGKPRPPGVEAAGVSCRSLVSLGLALAARLIL
jgi:hypothetical protein